MAALSLRAALRNAVRRIDAWFTADEPHAAGRMGWYRILYAAFYLWHVGSFDLRLLHGRPLHLRNTVLVNELLPAAPPEIVLAGIDRALVFALVLLLFGLKVRWATAAVLVIGVIRESFPLATGLEEGNIFLVFHIPLFMFVAGRWGETRSLDAWLRRRDGKTVPAASSHGSHFVAARAILVVLAALFTTSAAFKTLGTGTWLRHPDLLGNLMMHRSIDATLAGFGANPLAPWFAAHGTAASLLLLGTLVFEGTFWLALVDRRLRDFYLALALLFHSVNALWMMVSFTPILAVYALFIDWERRLAALLPRLPKAPSIPVAVPVGATLAVALATAWFWHDGIARLLGAGGALNWRSLWLPVLPLSALWMMRTFAGLLPRRARTGPGPLPPAPT